jgi:ubiquinone biosynthesis monooxygenase Coq7
MRYPGDLSNHEHVARMIRVNHAGEYGAKRIYDGQRAILKNPATREQIAHMAEQEQVHLDYFSEGLRKRRIRPSALLPLWHMAGFALGAATALLGERAAMACTIAVEEAIDEHYQSQLNQLETMAEPDLTQAITQFRADEADHRETGIMAGGEDIFAYPLLSSCIKAGSRLAIWLSTRV